MVDYFSTNHNTTFRRYQQKSCGCFLWKFAIPFSCGGYETDIDNKQRQEVHTALSSSYRFVSGTFFVS